LAASNTSSSIDRVVRMGTKISETGIAVYLRNGHQTSSIKHQTSRTQHHMSVAA
jgi:hypothetical protein